MGRMFCSLTKVGLYVNTRHVFTILSFASIMATAPVASAQQSVFIVAPPPIASPSFIKNQLDLKIRGTVLAIDDSMNSNAALSGAGGDAVFRWAFSDFFAANVQGGFFFIGGDMTSSTSGTTTKTTFLNENILLSVNGEFQPYKGNVVNVVIFGGPLFNLLFGNVDINTMTGAITSTSNETMSGALTGIQAGIQAGIKAGDVQIDPFAAVSSLRGSITISSSSGNVTSDIDPFKISSFGLDVIYTPWDFTLSSVIQKVAAQKSKGISSGPGYDVVIIQFGWHTQF